MEEKLDMLLERSQSKYFNYPVSAILECLDGNLFYGVNVETASPQAGICAERNAIFSAISCGYQKKDFKRLYLKAKTNKELYPCFICRQALVEFCEEDMEIVIYFEDDKKIVTVKELTPFSFSGDDLK